MKLIIDSGSSKSEWALVKLGKLVFIEEMIGMSPFFINNELFKNELAKSRLDSYKNQVSEIYFYGSGCNKGDQKTEELKNIILSYFKNITVLIIENDIIGACLSVGASTKSIVCILGTGSNSAIFDKSKILENQIAPGYVFGDFGGGSYFGKILLHDFLYQKLPFLIHNYLENEMNLTKEEIYKNVYSSHFPNRYLASFMNIYQRFIKEDYIINKLISGFDLFVENHIMCYKDFSNYPIYSVGSVGYFYKNFFEISLQKKDLLLEKAIQKPLLGLISI